jgi:KDO2-lipid IV(A) lauroyltransferase
MARERSPFLDYVVYFAVRCLTCTMQAMTWDLAYSFADCIAWLLHKIDKRHRRVAAENLRLAYPNLSDAEIDRIIRRVYRHYCAMIVEMIRGPRILHPHNLDHHFQYAEWKDRKRVVDLLNSNRPVILLTGHFGNWEIYGYAIGLYGCRLSAIARPLDNPYLDRFLNSFRGATGQRMIAKNGEFERVTALMQEGGNLATVADQDAGQKGLFVDFFGRPASTFKSIAFLAMEYDAMIVVGAAVRVGRPLRYEVLIEDFIDPKEYASTAGAAKEITQRYTTALERMVRRFPGQYLWLHRRWKHQPLVRKAKAKAA